MVGREWKAVTPLNDVKLIGTAKEKWLLPDYMYNKKTFPDYMAGPGYLLGREAANCIQEVSVG